MTSFIILTKQEKNGKFCYHMTINQLKPCELNIFVLQQQQNLGQRFGTSRCCLFYGSGSVVVYSMLIATPIAGFCNCSTFSYALLYVHSSFAINLGPLLCLSSCSLVIVVWCHGFVYILWLWYFLIILTSFSLCASLNNVIHIVIQL